MLVRERMKVAVWLSTDDSLASAARLLKQDNIGVFLCARTTGLSE
jgi:hypothetical protein